MTIIKRSISDKKNITIFESSKNSIHDIFEDFEQNILINEILYFQNIIDSKDPDLSKLNSSLIIIDSNIKQNKILKFVKELKSSIFTQNIPVLLITYNNTTDLFKRKCFDIGVVDFIPITISNIELKAKIEMTLNYFNDKLELEEKSDKITNIYNKFFENTFSAIALHEMIFDNSGEPIDYRFLTVNPSFETITTLKSEDIVGKTVLEVIPNLEYEWIRRYGEVIKTGNPIVFEDFNKFLNKYFEVKAFKTTGNQFVVIFTDITDRKRAAEEMVKLTIAIEQSPVSIIITDLEANIEYANSKFYELTGYSKEEAIGNNPRILKSEESSLNFEYKALWDTILSGETWKGEFLNKKKNSGLYWESATISPIFDSNNKITHFLAVKEDITELKRNMLDKERLEKQIRHKQKLETIGTLASGIAHDFNNILTSIMGYTDLVMLDLEESDQMYSDLKHVLNGAKKAKDLIERVLVFGKQSEKGKKVLRLQDVIEESLKLLRPTIPSTIKITKNMDILCGNIDGDSTQIHQVIMNLFTNAWQSMEGGKGEITIELSQRKIDLEMVQYTPFLGEGNYIYLTVKDTGKGIDKVSIDKIFDPFFTTKVSEKGTGLGLFVVHNIIRNHGGDIFVESEIGKGTKFSIYLPILKDTVKELEVNQEKNIIGGKESIIVVDDDTDIGFIVKKTLIRFGYTVEFFETGLEALNAFNHDPQKYDLILTDLTMPNMTGLDLAEQIYKKHPKFPVIIMSGYVDLLEIDFDKNKNVKQVINKPILLDFLLESIRKIFSE